MNLTPGQGRAVHAEGSVAITAGAGTGKTHTLGHRYLHHLACGLSPLQIVAVTFTEKAADELRARVRNYVGRYLSARPDALTELEASQISTIHALAARICRDHPDAAGVPPDFAVLSELEGRVWLAERFEEALAELPGELFERLPYHLCKETMDMLLGQPVVARTALDKDSANWPELVRRARLEALQELQKDPDWQEAARMVRIAAGVEGDKIEAGRGLAVQGLELLDEGRSADGLERLGAVKLQGGRQAAWPEGNLSAVKEALKLLRARARSALKDGLVVLELGSADERLAALLPDLRRAFDQVHAALERAKRQQRVLDFGDLEEHALQALGHAEVRDHYARRWKAILVDEFQDVNPVQEAVLGLLGDGTTLTIVGDDKQGIYGFRGADASVFRRVRDRICASGGGEVELTESFRSHTPLVHAINDTFRTVLEGLHQDLEAIRRQPPHAPPHLRLLAVAAEGESSKAQRQVVEARAIGSRVLSMLAEEMPVYDKDAQELRPVRPSDVAVLTRSWAPLDVYGEVLPGLGVPAVHTGGGSLLGTREAKDGLALLRFLADPADDLALAALLRSPLFACSDKLLYGLAHDLPRDDRFSWWEELEKQPREGFGRAVEALGVLVRLRRELPPSRLLQLADSLTGYSAVLANMPGAGRREADWSGFQQLVRTLERGLQDAFSVVRRLRRILASGLQVPRPVLEAGEAVTLMTIHRSKGLEWPVVFVADLTRKPGGRRPKARMDPELGVAVGLADYEESTAQRPALLTILEQQADKAEKEEAKRVLYVALTRARDRLVLSATETKGGLLDLLMPGLSAAGVPCEDLPFDRADAAYPAQPAPGESRSEDSGLWACEPENLGDLAKYVARKFPQEEPPAASSSGDWVLAREFMAALYPEYEPLAEALQHSGVPVPDADGYESELTRAGMGTAVYAMLTWSVGGKRLALVDSALAEANFDQALIGVDPDDLGAGVEAVLSALRRTTCGS